MRKFGEENISYKLKLNILCAFYVGGIVHYLIIFVLNKPIKFEMIKSNPSKLKKN